VANRTSNERNSYIELFVGHHRSLIDEQAKVHGTISLEVRSRIRLPVAETMAVEHEQRLLSTAFPSALLNYRDQERSLPVPVSWPKHSFIE
jgi:hypothetical protein